MPLSFTSPSGFRFFALMMMITAILLGLAKSIVDQIPSSPLIRFSSINLIGFFLFISSLLYGKNIHKSRHQWFNNAFLTAGVVLLTYGSTVEVEGAIHSSYLPIFYIVEILIILVVGNKIKLETNSRQYVEMTSSHFENNL